MGLQSVTLQKRRRICQDNIFRLSHIHPRLCECDICVKTPNLIHLAYFTDTAMTVFNKPIQRWCFINGDR